MANVIQFTVRGKDQNTQKLFGSIAKGIAGIAAAIGGIAAIKGISTTVVSFEKLRLSINTVSKSAADARNNMKFIEDFAATTPFDLNQVTDSFIKLKALGLDPSEAALRSYGNTASAMGKSLNQMIEAVADATVGEFERLKEFGIKARNEGDTIKFTFQGVTTSVANNAEAIEAHLQSIGSVTFAGAMTTQANSVVGAVSNMQDSFVRLGVALGDAGIRPLIRQVALAITGMVQTIIDNKDRIRAFITGVLAFGLVLKQVFVTIVGGIRTLLDQDLRSAITSIVDTFKKVGEIIISWAASVVPAIGKILLTGFPIILAGLVDIFVKTFSNIGRLMGNIIVLSLSAILKTFQAFGEAVNDVLQQAITGAAGPSFAEALAQRFSEAFEGALEQAKKTVGGGAAEIGGQILDGVVETVRQIGEEIGPLIDESTESIVSASGEAGSAMAELFGINMEGILAQAELMTEGLQAFQDKADESNELAVEANATLMESFRGAWETFIKDQGNFVTEFSKRMVAMGKTVAKSIGQAFADTIVSGKNLMKGLQEIGKQVITALIAQLVELGVQRLILAVIGKTANVTEASTGAAKAVGLTFANQMASMSGAPFPINLTAPAVAAGMAAAAAAGFSASAASGAAVGASVAGAAHGGLDFVPSESTFLLQRGERVLSPNQNRDLTDFLNEGGGGLGGVQIENMHILENVTSAEPFLEMSDEEVKQVVADRIITALDQLNNEGVRPAFVNEISDQ